MDRINQGGRVAVLANFFLDIPVSDMHSIYIVLKKVSETCYPPSLSGKSLFNLVRAGFEWGKNSSYTRRT